MTNLTPKYKIVLQGEVVPTLEQQRRLAALRHVVQNVPEQALTAIDATAAIVQVYFIRKALEGISLDQGLTNRLDRLEKREETKRRQKGKPRIKLGQTDCPGCREKRRQYRPIG